MSNLSADPSCNEPSIDQPCAAIDLIIKPREKDLDGFSVRRVLPYYKRRKVGPWVFFDHLGPVEFKAGTGVDVRPHPHINLATVTYLFEGSILHRDSLGYEVEIRPGDINLMVAGRGITHSERETERVHNHHHRLHALQLWLALPEADEETEPAFHHYAAADIPTIDRNGVPVRVMIGTAWGVTSPVRTFAETLYLEARLSAGQSLQLPAAQERALYVAAGAVRIDGTLVNAHYMAVLGCAEALRIDAEQDSRIAVIGGESLSDRHMYWNFVSSRVERIEQAKRDWRDGRFDPVVGDAEEFIPLPDE